MKNEAHIEYYAAYIFFVITRESLFYANLRQTYLNSPAYVNRISSRTVLFMSVPESYKSEKKLRQVFGDSICRIWITSDCKELKKKVDQRDKLAYRLERAEIKLIRGTNAARLKAEATKEKSGFNVCDDCELADPLTATKIKRPMHRANFFGKKVDSIQYYRSRLAVAIKEVEELQQRHRDGDAKYLTAVFVEFKTQSDAQVALQTLSHHQPMHMTPRYSGIAPREVIWSSLNLSWWQRIIRMFVVQGGIAALIIFWSVPAAIVGTISNVTYLANLIPFLGWLGHLPGFIEGVITGLLPSAALILLMSLVPPICRRK
jgi:calcium permeable stress-gated cation channel